MATGGDPQVVEQTDEESSPNATEARREPAPLDAHPANPPAQEPKASDASSAAPHPAAKRPRHAWRTWLLVVAILFGLALLAYYLLPWLILTLSTVSTDDAYVNGHVTFVAPRVAGQVAQVLVDDTMRVQRGDLLVQLDKEPYRVQVRIQQAAVVSAEADLRAARAQVRALEATARGQRWQLQTAMEQVADQIANLRAAVATYQSRLANQALSEANYRRGEELVRTQSISREEYEQRREAAQAAEAASNQALQSVYAIRVTLGLPPKPSPAQDLTEVPKDLEQNFSAVRAALATLEQTTAQIGLPLPAWQATPREVLDHFRQLAVHGDIDRILEELIPKAPAVIQAESKLLQAQRNLEQAQLNLRYCDIVSDIDGVVTRRNVNPGNNVPVGCLSLFLTSIVVHDPPYMDRQRAARRGKPLDLDLVGLGLIALGLGALEVIYDRGQEHDWFNSRRIVTLAILAGAGLVAAIVWELRHRNPVVNLRLLKDRSFAVASLVIYCAFAVVYGSNVLLPQMVQALFGYDAYTAGLVMSPAGIVVMLCMPISGFLLGRKVDARYLIFFGLLCVAAGSYWTSLMNLDVSPGVIVLRRCAQLVGMGFVFAPVNTAAYQYLPEEQRSNATGLFNVFRNEGASLGIAMVSIVLAQRGQLHQSRLVDNLTPLNQPYVQIHAQLTQQFQHAGYDAVTAGNMALGQIYQGAQQQALLLSYLDLFWMFAIIAVCVAPLVFLMRRSVAESGVLAVH